MNTPTTTKRHPIGAAHLQRGGTAIGLIVGVLVGLVAALGVAVYVTKVPVPFVNKGSGRGAEHDAAESKKNKDWDPNAPLYGKVPAKPAAVASGPIGEATAVPAKAPAVAAPGAATGIVAPAQSASAATAKPTDSKVTESKVTESKGATSVAAKPDAAKTPAKAAASDPIADFAKPKGKAGAEAADPFVHFVQIGAYRTENDAEAQRAKAALAGLEAKVTEREVSGRTVYRVRVGPLDRKDDAQKAKERLEAAGLEAQIVSINR